MTTVVIDHDGYAHLIESFISASQARRYFQQLSDELHWHHETITIFGRKQLAPRLVAWYGEPGVTYRYSGAAHPPQPWTETLLHLKNGVEEACQQRFNGVLANLYRNGRDSVGWHADNEKSLGPDPCIASLSFGATRTFKLRHNKTGETVAIALTSGGLLVMGGQLQHCWRHSLPKTTKVDAPRINLTFRRIIA